MFHSTKLVTKFVYSLVFILFILSTGFLIRFEIADLGNKPQNFLNYLNSNNIINSKDKNILSVSSSTPTLNEFNACEALKTTDKTQNFVFPETEFDAEVAIPETNVILSYPSKGFYDLGVKIFNRELSGLGIAALGADKEDIYKNVEISTDKPYDYLKRAKYVGLSAFLIHILNKNETLESFIGSLDTESIFADYVKKGKYEKINGKKFFIYKYSETTNGWRAYVETSGKLVVIGFVYSSNGCPESNAAYKNNDQLFREILSHIKFE